MTNDIINIQTKTDQEMLFNTNERSTIQKVLLQIDQKKGQATNFFLMGGGYGLGIHRVTNPNDQ